MVIFGAVGLLLTGCSATGPTFKEAATPSSDKALVYIYRPSAFVLRARDAHFFVDGKELVGLSNNGYTQMYLPEGQHQIAQSWAMGGITSALLGQGTPTVGLSLNVKAGQTYYFRFSTGAGEPSYPAIVLRWQITQVPTEIGSAEIVETRYQPAKQ